MNDSKLCVRNFWLITAAAACGVILSDTLQNSLGAVVFPFAAAFVAAKLVRPAGVYFSRLARVRERTGCILFGILLCGAAVIVLTQLGGRLWDEVRAITEYLPEYAGQAAEKITSVTENLAEHLPFLHDRGETTQLGGLVEGAFREAASELGGTVAGAVGSAVSGFPGGMVSVVIAVIAFLYLVADMDGIGRSMNKLLRCFLSDETAERVVRTFGRLSDSVFAYLRSYLILVLITFAELAVGFALIGVENPLSAALGVALIDALPLFGCGIVIIPWALWCFLEGNFRRGIALVVLQVVVYAGRQFLEPKVIGRMTGVHPFAALLVLFAGLKIGGVTGMVLAPVLLMSVVRMREE